MSEPWIVDEFHPLSAAGSERISKTGEKGTLLFSTPFLKLPNGNASSPAPLAPSTIDPHVYVPELIPSAASAVPVGIAAWASRKMNVHSAIPLSIGAGSSQYLMPMLPQILEGDYSTVYNKNGRIGIYTKEERQSIISRFQDKRRTRVWKKKIRYHCRKNLADRRIRIKVSQFSLSCRFVIGDRLPI
jgi:CCT motif